MIKYHILNSLRTIKSYLVLKFQILRGHVELTLNGGFGDIVLDSQFLVSIKEKYPRVRVSVYYRDDKCTANPEGFSWGKTRHYTTKDGTASNPITEWLNSLGAADDVIGCNIDDKTYGVRVYPESFHKFFGGYWSPKLFNSRINKKVFEHHNSQLSAPYEQYRSKIYGEQHNVVVLHLRRNVNKILSCAKKIQDAYPNTLFVILGSTEHQQIPDYSIMKNHVSLVDSYQLGLNTLDVLSLTKRANLFIGGRGGFELFHWLSEVPTVCFFDAMGMQEIKQLWWDKQLWENNIIPHLYDDNTDVSSILETIQAKKLLS
jgi:hypothetical protein